MHNYFTVQSSAKTIIIPFNYITIVEHSGGSNDIIVYTTDSNTTRMTCKDFNEVVKLLNAYTTWLDRNEPTSPDFKPEEYQKIVDQIGAWADKRDQSAKTTAYNEQPETHQTCATCHQDCSFIGADMVACAKHIY